MDLTLTPRLPTTLLLSPTPFPLCRRRTLRPIRAVTETPDVPVPTSIFGPPREISGPEFLVGTLPPPVRKVTSIALAAASLAAGYKLGLQFVQTRGGGIAGAAAAGVAGGGVVYSLSAGASKVAAARIHNLVAGSDDGRALKKGDVDTILRSYGVSKDDEVIKAELRELYSRFVSSVIPLGGEDLNGNEVETILKFKEALGIDDPDAASVHMEIGRHIFRERLETGEPEANAEQRRVFQRFIYVSTLVFGEASKFLLPWKRIFKVSDAQVDIAVRDNAQRLYALKLKSISRGIEAKQLIDLRKSQLLYKLSDKIAAEMFREHTRKLIEENVSEALDMLKSVTKATRGTRQVIEELEKILTFNDCLTQLIKNPDAGKFVPGVRPVSLLGGKYDSDRKIGDLKLLYSTYVAESFSSGHFEEKKLVALNHLKNIFGLGKLEAEDILIDIKSKIYRKQLSRAFSSGDLVAAVSKAEYLQILCHDLSFDAQKASEIHEEIYRQKLHQFVADGELDGVDVAALKRLRVLLCIPQQTVDAAHADICGRLFEVVVRDAIASGVEGYDPDVRTSIQKALQGLQLTVEGAMAIASKAVRKVFMSYIQQSRSSGDHTETAKELKKMIAFNTLVVTELISDIKGESVTESAETVNEESEQTDEEEEWESLQSLQKTKTNTELQEKLEKPIQKEINLKDDLPQRDRADLYKTYLQFCLSGEVIVVPFGAQITTKKDNTEYLFLRQLGEILGLTGKEIVEIHRNLAEQAFTKQAEVILADGQFTKERIENLNEVQPQVGLPAEFAGKVIKNITSAKLGAAIEKAVSQGTIGLKQFREWKETLVDLDSMVPVGLREYLFKRTLKDIFSSGTGVFDEEEVYVKIPAELGIDSENAKRVAQMLAKDRFSNSLVQAVALLRQRNRQGVVSSLHDILACDIAAAAEQPLLWSSPQELLDLYCIYLKSYPDSDKMARLQFLLGIGDSTAAMLRDSTEQEPLCIEEEEAFAF